MRDRPRIFFANSFSVISGLQTGGGCFGSCDDLDVTGYTDGAFETCGNIEKKSIFGGGEEMKFHSVLFDFDGTLANTLPLAIHGFQAVFEKYDGRTIDLDGIVAMLGTPDDVMIAENFKHKDQIPAAIEEYYRIYETEHDRFVEKSPEILAMIQFLKARGIKVGVITGKTRRAYRLSEKALELSGLFDSVVTGDEVDKPKPDPQGILRTLERFGATKDEAIYIGDSNNDVRAGKAAGIHTAGVHWLPMSQSKTFPAGPDYYWTSVDQLLDLIKKDK